jgi:formylglycine-generating enzyme required for sulfatase activity
MPPVVPPVIPALPPPNPVIPPKVIDPALVKPVLPKPVDVPAAHRKMPVAKQNFQIPKPQIDLIYIAPGSFQMGSKISEADRTSSEPLHEVRITEGFWLGRTEVSVKQFAVFIAASGYRTDAEKRGGSSAWLSRGNWKKKQAGARWNEAGETSELPVVHVSWSDAMRFCSWLTEQEKKAGVLPADYAYSLPSEAQWEYAARADTKGPWQGAARLADIAVTASEFAPAKAGSKAANAWGLQDMIGNVWEWTQDASNGSDHLNPSLSTLTEGIKDPVSHKGNRHIYRGGSWADGPEAQRCAMRAQSVYVDEAFSGNNHGFRLALIPVKLVGSP